MYQRGKEMEPLRLRLKFIGRRILSESQRSDGLRRSWVLLKPQHETVSDVVSHIFETFDLHDSCPNGLILSMDGFVLPSFESTAILKDKDLICVKRKGAMLVDMIREHEQANMLVDKIVEKQPTALKLLANEEFVKETGGYESEEEEEPQHDVLLEETTPNGDATLKKQKASKDLKSFKRKRLRKLSPENDEISPQKKHVGRNLRCGECRKKSAKNRNKLDEVQTPELAEREPNKNGEGTVTSSSLPDDSKQCSRSTKHKKFQKQQLQGPVSAEKEKLNNKELNEGDVNGDMRFRKDENVNTDKQQQSNEEIDSEEEIVPVVIRPGHIRFAPSGKEKEVQQIGSAKESYQWNGIFSKKKGQKWGKEKQYSTLKLNGWAQKKQSKLDPSEWAQGKKSAPEWNGWVKKKKSTPEWNKYEAPNGNNSSNHAKKKAPSANDPMDFEKLVPMTDFPVQGDIIAYRLLVLTSSWCLELSSYRVGKVSWFDPKSNKVMLVPVPEYPFDFETRTDENATEELPDSSHYKEDGSLEIDFPSLADVRIIKRGDLNSEAAHQVVNAAPIAKDAPSSETGLAVHAPFQAQPSSNVTADNSLSPEKGLNDVWEEISEALSAKKAQLLQEDKWNKKPSPSNRSWSYRTLQSSVLGPTMALLRAQNGA